MTHIALLNILIYIYLLIFTILFLFIINFFFYQIILTSWSRTHDRHIILTFFISKLWISRVNPFLPRAILFSFIFFGVAFIFILLLK